MQLTCIAWVESSDSRDDGKGKIYRYCQKHKNLSLPYLLSILPFVWCFVYYEPPCQISCTTLTSQNTTENNCIILYAKNTCTSSQCIFNWNTSVTGHKQVRVIFPQRKQLPRSTETSPVSVSRSSVFSRICPTTDTSAFIFPLQLSCHHHRALLIDIKFETSICLGIDFLGSG